MRDAQHVIRAAYQARPILGKSLIVLQETQSLILWGWNRKDEIKTTHGHHTDLHYQKQTKGAKS